MSASPQLERHYAPGISATGLRLPLPSACGFSPTLFCPSLRSSRGCFGNSGGGTQQGGRRPATPARAAPKQDDRGWIRALLDEAENERMHLMNFLRVAQPSRPERWRVIAAQGVFYDAYFLIYLISSRTAHRLVGNFGRRSRPQRHRIFGRRGQWDI